ncbi:MAG TPA: M23 family metallopeptidase [Gemmatimonadales bacterium]|nr:M23 family metallopeptidase [Gemmatimonadales bacterium]
MARSIEFARALPRLALAAGLWTSGAATELRAQGAILPPPFELRVPKPPTLATADAGAFLVYELHITNLGGQPVTLKRIEVEGVGAGGVLSTLSDTTLTRSLSRPGFSPPLPAAERTKLGGGLRAVVFLWVPVDGRSPPGSVRHRITVEQGSGDSVRTQSLEGAEVPVVPEAVAIGPPLRGGPWLAGNGPAPASGHRRALVPIGTAAIAQRFAIDWVKVGDDFRTFTGDSLKNSSYRAYGDDALAVADGIVAAVKDGIVENVPGINSRAVPITLETVGGNHVVLDIGHGRYAFYAHLQPGSLRVKVGDRVRKGQVLGLVGNSGNSTEPHLHFHISDGVAPLGSEGIPYRYETFELVGGCRDFGSGCELSPAVARRLEIPLGNMIVRFP